MRWKKKTISTVARENEKKFHRARRTHTERVEPRRSRPHRQTLRESNGKIFKRGVSERADEDDGGGGARVRQVRVVRSMVL